MTTPDLMVDPSALRVVASRMDALADRVELAVERLGPQLAPRAGGGDAVSRRVTAEIDRWGRHACGDTTRTAAELRRVAESIRRHALGYEATDDATARTLRS